jgi:hypothetical protein
MAIPNRRAVVATVIGIMYKLPSLPAYVIRKMVKAPIMAAATAVNKGIGVVFTWFAR